MGLAVPCVAVVLVLALAVVNVRPARVTMYTACKADVNNRVINLQALQRTDGQPRFKVEYNGWNYTFNPCVAFNYPLNPSSASGDQCHYVAICQSRVIADGLLEAYAIGLQRSVRFKTPLQSGQIEDKDAFDISEEEQRSVEAAKTDSSEEGTSEEADIEDSPSDNSSDGAMINKSKLSSNYTATYKTASYNNMNTSDKVTRPVPNAPSLDSEIKASHKNITDLTQLENNNNKHVLNNVSEPQHRKEPERKESLQPEDGYNISPRLKLHHVLNTTFLVFRGERTYRHSRVYVALRCDYSRVLPEEALFRPFPLYFAPFMVFELFHYCCCPDACAFTEQWQQEIILRSNLSNHEVERGDDPVPAGGPRHIWLILVINLAVLIVAVLIGAVCCRKGGSPAATSYYSYLPALHSSRMTLNSTESSQCAGGSAPKMHVPSADYLDYSSNIIKSRELPKLSNCLISSHSLEIGQRLGGGIFGDTYLGEWKDRPIAAKRITAGIHQGQLQKEMDDYILQDTTKLSKQRHKCLVAVLGVCTDMRQPYIITEFIEGETLKEILKRTGEDAMKMSKRIKLCTQAADGVAFLHSAKPPILHRDLRCANILVDRNERAKVVDYGMTRITQRLRKQCTALKGCFCQRETSAIPAFTRWTAPEILNNPTADESNYDVLSPAVDAYSFGMVLWEVVSLTDPFEEISDDNEVQDIVKDGGRPRWDLLQNLAPQYRDLMRACWDQNPDVRPSFKKIAVHLKALVQMFNKASHIRVDSFSLRGSLSSLAVSSEVLRRKQLAMKDPQTRNSSLHSEDSSWNLS